IDNAPPADTIPIADVPTPPATNTPTPTSAGPECDPSYPDVCIAPAPPDFDCGEIPYQQFRVIGADPHGFDGDGDGIGCEGDPAPQAPTPVPPTPIPPTAVPPQQQCDPNYAGACIPLVGYDLN